MNPSQQRVTIIFSREQRETIRKALEKLRNGYSHNWDYFNGNVGESAFIRDAVTYTARQILDSKGRGELISKQVQSVWRMTDSLQSECGRLRKLLTLKPDRRKAKVGKGRSV